MRRASGHGLAQADRTKAPGDAPALVGVLTRSTMRAALQTWCAEAAREAAVLRGQAVAARGGRQASTEGGADLGCRRSKIREDAKHGILLGLRRQVQA